MKYDLIVVGTGGIGSAALYHAAQCGWNVLGIDRFAPPHERGSSHGQTRMIRQAYFEHADYLPLLRKSYRMWDDLERERGQTLFVRTGLLEVGYPDGPIIDPILQCAKKYDLPVETLTADQAKRRLPMFHIDSDMSCVFEANAGYLHVEACIQAHLEEARRMGAEMVCNQAVQAIEESDSGVRLVCADTAWESERVIVCGGGWANQLLPELPITEVRRKHQYWFETDNASIWDSAVCPPFFFETRDGYFYGIPRLDAKGLKVAQHSGGEPVHDPTNIDRELDESDLASVQRFVGKHLQVENLSLIEHAVCMYTMTADEHFLIDLVAGSTRIAYAAGLSGHGFKFAPAIGNYLVELLKGNADPDFDFLSAHRFDS